MTTDPHSLDSVQPTVGCASCRRLWQEVRDLHAERDRLKFANEVFEVSLTAIYAERDRLKAALEEAAKKPGAAGAIAREALEGK